MKLTKEIIYVLKYYGFTHTTTAPDIFLEHYNTVEEFGYAGFIDDRGALNFLRHIFDENGVNVSGYTIKESGWVVDGQHDTQALARILSVGDIVNIPVKSAINPEIIDVEPITPEPIEPEPVFETFTSEPDPVIKPEPAPSGEIDETPTETPTETLAEPVVDETPAETPTEPVVETITEDIKEEIPTESVKETLTSEPEPQLVVEGDSTDTPATEETPAPKPKKSTKKSTKKES